MSEPPITRRAAHGSRRQGTPVRVVIHDEEFPVGVDSAEHIAGYFATAAAGGSAHYVVDADSEQHCVPDDVAAWHAPPNDRSVGIEQDGFAHFKRGDWLLDGSRRTLARTVARTAELCVRFGIPPRRIGVADLRAGARGVCGHVDVSNAWHQTDHGDPGPAYPWDVFLVLLEEGHRRLNGDAAVRAFQAQHGLAVDGDAGRLTVAALATELYGRIGMPVPRPTTTPPATVVRVMKNGDTGPDVSQLQRDLNYVTALPATPVKADGAYGPATEAAVRQFQRNMGLFVDGITGPATLTRLHALVLSRLAAEARK